MSLTLCSDHQYIRLIESALFLESFLDLRVYKILDGKKEVERVLFRSEGEDGFSILPDLKWDQTSVSALVSPLSRPPSHQGTKLTFHLDTIQYLTVIVNTRSIRSLRDLQPSHIHLLKDIKAQAHAIAKNKFGVPTGKLRLFVHYQPSYCASFLSLSITLLMSMSWWGLDHFHVHVVHIDHEGLAGMTVGQAHLLDDLISLVRPFQIPSRRIPQLNCVSARVIDRG